MPPPFFGCKKAILEPFEVSPQAPDLSCSSNGHNAQDHRHQNQGTHHQDDEKDFHLKAPVHRILCGQTKNGRTGIFTAPTIAYPAYAPRLESRCTRERTTEPRLTKGYTYTTYIIWPKSRFTCRTVWRKKLEDERRPSGAHSRLCFGLAAQQSAAEKWPKGFRDLYGSCKSKLEMPEDLPSSDVDRL